MRRSPARSMLCLLALWQALPFGPLIDVSHAAPPEPAVRFCADDAQWPPFSYRVGDAPVQGMTVDLIRQAFAASQVDIQIDPLPWKRCLAATQGGREYQVALDASANPERREKYLLTQPYYELTPYYFYSRRQLPEGVRIRHGRELARYGTVCGLPGYNYSNFALEQTEVYTGAPDFYAMAEMTRRGRCAVFVGRYEIIAGMALIGPDLLADPDIAYAPIPDARPEPFYMLISRQAAQAEALKQRLDQAIGRLTDSGELKRLQQRYLARPQTPP